MLPGQILTYFRKDYKISDFLEREVFHSFKKVSRHIAKNNTLKYNTLK